VTTKPVKYEHPNTVTRISTWTGHFIRVVLWAPFLRAERHINLYCFSVTKQKLFKRCASQRKDLSITCRQQNKLLLSLWPFYHEGE